MKILKQSNSPFFDQNFQFILGVISSFKLSPLSTLSHIDCLIHQFSIPMKQNFIPLVSILMEQHFCPKVLILMEQHFVPQVSVIMDQHFASQLLILMKQHFASKLPNHHHLFQSPSSKHHNL
jgi:hypothetical protein